MKYYKVVRREKGGLFSALVPSHNRFRRKYQKGEWTESRKGSFLFVFTCKGVAEVLRDWNTGPRGMKYGMWECEIQGKCGVRSVVDYFAPFSEYKKFWDCVNYSDPFLDRTLLFGESSIHTDSSPFSTVGAKRVKLIKEIA